MPSYDDIFRDDEDEDSDGGDSGNESDGGSEPSGKRRRFDEVGFLLSLLISVRYHVLVCCWIGLIFSRFSGGSGEENRAAASEERVGGSKVSHTD